jgi:hypothetical protein
MLLVLVLLVLLLLVLLLLMQHGIHDHRWTVTG